MNEEEKRLYDQDMEQYGITFEEWITKMEEIAEEVEREQQIKSMIENSINIFTSEDNNINKRNFKMLRKFVKSIKGE